jgi:hypothetical protein
MKSPLRARAVRIDALQSIALTTRDQSSADGHSCGSAPTDAMCVVYLLCSVRRPVIRGSREPEVAMNGPREPNVRYQPPHMLDQTRNVRREASAPNPRRAILTLGTKATADSARPSGWLEFARGEATRTP